MIAKRRITTKSRKTVSSADLVPTKDNDIKSSTLRDFGRSRMTTYAISVNLDRSVPDMYDGLKPVQRRNMYGTAKEAFSSFEKTARIVGVVLGRYHPHGDKSISDAITTMVNHPTSVFYGKGNWGNMVDGAAAMRYTNMQLSAYGQTFFDPNYLHASVTSFVPNYDNKEVEPVTLPAQLPNVILNGGEGIGVGITTLIPTFTPDSVILILERMLKGEVLAPTDYARTLKFAHKWGGQLLKTPENKKGWMGLFTGSETQVKFESELQVELDRKKLIINDWPPGTNLQKFVEKVRAMPETLRCFNSKGSATLTIECKPAYNLTQFEKYVEKIRLATRKSVSFKLNVTKRKAQILDGVTTFKTEFLALSVPELLKQWLVMRIELERKSLAYRQTKQRAAIAYSELLIYACDKLDIIVKALRAKDPDMFLTKNLEIDGDQAKQILELRVRQLSKLDQEVLKLKLKEQRLVLKQLDEWLKRPRSKVLLDLAEVKAAILKDRSFQANKDTRKLKVI